MDVQSPSVSRGAVTKGAPSDEMQRVFRLQKAHQSVVRHTSAAERIAGLKRLREALLDRRTAFHDALYADFRKPPVEVDVTELYFVKSEIDHAILHLKRWMRPKQVRTPLTLLGTTSEIHYEPKGTALIISPWNYPVNLTLGPLVGALAAGCTAMLKPAEHIPHTARLMKDLLADVFDEREVALFEGGKSVAQALLKLPFDHIYFTGSPQVGKSVMKAAAEHLASVTLELGGKSPSIVDETADVEDAAKKIVFSKFANAGQTCIAPDYVYVHERHHDTLVEAMHRHIRRFFGEQAEAQSPSADFARIVNDAHHDRLRSLYETALEAGAQAVAGATCHPEERYLAPTILTDVPDEAPVMQEEIFGPVLPVIPFSSLDDVLDGINSRPKPLALYLFSRSKENTEKVLANTSAGGTCINDLMLHFLHLNLPFGGVGTSGFGKGHGHYGFLAFSNERPVLRQHLKRSPIQLFYPPYGRRSKKVVDLLLRFF